MIAMLMGPGLNVILDPIFIYRLDTGIAGSAFAIAIAQVITTVMYLFYIFKKSSIFSFSPKDFRFERSIYKEIFKVGILTLAFQLATSIEMVLRILLLKNIGTPLLHQWALFPELSQWESMRVGICKRALCR